MACIARALIIGGGIAGLSSAIALARAGVACDVVELADEPLGAAIGISGRAAEALDELGVYDACYAQASKFTNDSTVLTQHDPAGNITSPGPKRPPEWPGAKTAIGIYRPILLKNLADAALDLGATIRRGITTQTIEEDADSSFVTFTDGTTGIYDLVVGADGISSATRTWLFPEAPKPEYTGQISLRFMAPGDPIADEGWYNGPVGRLGFYSLPQNLVYVPAEINAPERKRLNDVEVYDLFVKLLDSYTAPAVVELRSRLKPDSQLVCRPFDWILLDTWHKGRTLLIGDAAHATSAHLGQGGGMALEDAVVLGQCIAAASTLPEALNAFMTRRFERVRTVVETSVALCHLGKEKADPSKNMEMIKTALLTIAQPY